MLGGKQSHHLNQSQHQPPPQQHQNESQPQSQQPQTKSNNNKPICHSAITTLSSTAGISSTLTTLTGNVGNLLANGGNINTGVALCKHNRRASGIRITPNSSPKPNESRIYDFLLPNNGNNYIIETVDVPLEQILNNNDPGGPSSTLGTTDAGGGGGCANKTSKSPTPVTPNISTNLLTATSSLAINNTGTISSTANKLNRKDRKKSRLFLSQDHDLLTDYIDDYISPEIMNYKETVQKSPSIICKSFEGIWDKEDNISLYGTPKEEMLPSIGDSKGPSFMRSQIEALFQPSGTVQWM